MEQILASHTQVFGAGEQEGLLHLAAKIPFQLRDRRPYPDCMERASASDLDTWSEEYLRSLPKEAADSAHFVDKMPFNFLHIGLISRLFPKARIVHCRRDPQDTCLSVFFQQFSPYYAFSTDLVGLAGTIGTTKLDGALGSCFPGKLFPCSTKIGASPEELIPKMLDDYGLCGFGKTRDRWTPLLMPSSAPPLQFIDREIEAYADGWLLPNFGFAMNAQASDQALGYAQDGAYADAIPILSSW